MSGFYSAFLALHGWNRWAVLMVTLTAALAGFWGWKTRQPYSRGFRRVAWTSVWISSLQAVLGLMLHLYYGTYMQALWRNPVQALRNGEVRFFGVEHALAMFLAIGLVHLGAARARKSGEAALSQRWLALSHAGALALMLLSIPWWRPWLR